MKDFSYTDFDYQRIHLEKHGLSVRIENYVVELPPAIGGPARKERRFEAVVENKMGKELFRGNEEHFKDYYQQFRSLLIIDALNGSQDSMDLSVKKAGIFVACVLLLGAMAMEAFASPTHNAPRRVQPTHQPVSEHMPRRDVQRPRQLNRGPLLPRRAAGDAQKLRRAS